VGNPNCKLSFRHSIGASGGLLTMWDIADVEVWSSVSCEHVMLIHDNFIKSNEDFCLFKLCPLRS